MADADELAGTEGQAPVTERTVRALFFFVWLMLYVVPVVITFNYTAVPIEILVAEIPENLQQKAKRRVCLAMDKYDIDKDIATDVKKHFDEECEGSWHCVSGRSFGCSVTHETKHLFFFKCDHIFVLLFCSPE